ncbi:MAG: hypothetical protein HY866_09995, partial [Chloroflexi bacterium]|nr:hypothetical protein [Chloroflexota bacterium]
MRHLRLFGLFGILKHLSLPLIVGAATLVFVPTLHADTGPHPSADFEFDYEIDRVPIVEGQLIICEDKACTQSHPLEEVAWQSFTCGDYSCSSRAYGYGRYLKLVITFEDRVRESKVFEKHDFDAVFVVTVTQSGLVVREKIIVITGEFILALIFTLLSETLVAIPYWWRYSLPHLRLLWVPIASLITLPILWFGFSRLFSDDYAAIGLGEIFVVVFEAGFLYVINRGALTGRQAAVLSLSMNAVSFLLGLCGAVF